MEFRFSRTLIHTLTGVALLCTATLPLAAHADSAVTVYFTRHAEKMTELMDLGDGKR